MNPTEETQHHSDCHKLAALPNEIGKLVKSETVRLSCWIKLAESAYQNGKHPHVTTLDISGSKNSVRLPEQTTDLHLSKRDLMGC